MKNAALIANLRASAESGNSIEIAGGIFSPEDQLAAAMALDERNQLRETLEPIPQWLGMALESGAFSRCALPNAPRRLLERINMVLKSFPR